MKLNCSARDLPEFARRVPDISECEPQAELDRCLRVLSWLESLTVTELLRPHLPAINSDLIGVVVPMYNASRWIELCIKGLLAQTHSNLEIFCVDDASEDDTYQRVVEQFGRDRRLCVIRLAENVGPYQIKNWVAGSLARAELIAMQDADDISHPMRLEEQRNWMLRSGYRISGTCVHQFFPEHIKYAAGLTTPFEANGMLHNLAFYSSSERNQVSTAVHGSKKKGLQAPLTDGLEGFQVYNYDLTHHGTQLMDRTLLLEFGGFDGRTRFGADTDFERRLLHFNNIGNIPKVLYSRRFHDLSLTQQPSTGLASPSRQQYRLKVKALQQEVDQNIGAGNMERVRELCTADLFQADIKVDDFHTGFEVKQLKSRGAGNGDKD